MFKRIKAWSRGIFLRWMQTELDRRTQAISDNLTAAITLAGSHAAKAAREEVNYVVQQLSALQAVDVDFREAGKLIVIARVQGRDIVKIINIPSTYSLPEWKSICNEMEHRFGAKVRWADLPHEVPRETFLQ